MQPKNTRDSIDFKVTETNLAGHGSFIPADGGGITGDKITISSKERSNKLTHRQTKTLNAGEATNSSMRAREGKFKHQAQKTDYNRQ